MRKLGVLILYLFLLIFLAVSVVGTLDITQSALDFTQRRPINADGGIFYNPGSAFYNKAPPNFFINPHGTQQYYRYWPYAQAQQKFFGTMSYRERVILEPALKEVGKDTQNAYYTQRRIEQLNKLEEIYGPLAFYGNYYTMGEDEEETKELAYKGYVPKFPPASGDHLVDYTVPPRVLYRGQTDVVDRYNVNMLISNTMSRRNTNWDLYQDTLSSRALSPDPFRVAYTIPFPYSGNKILQKRQALDLVHAPDNVFIPYTESQLP